MNTTKQKLLKIILSGYLLAFSVFTYLPQAGAAPIDSLGDIPAKIAQLTKQAPVDSLIPYSGPEQSIKDFLCAPSQDNLGFALYDCISRLYRFGIAAGALALVFFIVLAGYFYILGGETSKAKGKSIFMGALTGMTILLLSYVLLNFINPNLVRFRPIQPPIFTSADLPTCESVGFSKNCIIGSGSSAGQVFYAGVGEKGQCTQANLSQCSKWKVDEAVAVCNIESKGYTQAKSGTDKCSNFKGPDGDLLSFSYGLMQVSLASMGEAIPECKNILWYPSGSELRQDGNCPGGWGTAQKGTPYCKARLCKAPRGEEILKKCAQMLFDVANNIKASCELYGKSCWKPWPDTGKIVPNYEKCPR